MQFKEFRRKAIAKRTVGLFTVPEINRAENGDWFIGYRYRISGTGQWSSVFKERGNLKGFANITDKEKEAEILRQDVLDWLQQGNSPYENY